MNEEKKPYGLEDTSYKAAGQIEGLQKLVKAFYSYMDLLPEAKIIRAMHPQDLTLSIEKLACFLSGWLGGPKLFSAKFGPINIPKAQSHLPISYAEGDAWMLCMQKAVADQSYDDSFKAYLVKELRVPTERIRRACSKQFEG